VGTIDATLREAPSAMVSRFVDALQATRSDKSEMGPRRKERVWPISSINSSELGSLRFSANAFAVANRHFNEVWTLLR